MFAKKVSVFVGALTIFGVGLVAAPAEAQTKIGVINIDKVLQDSQRGKAMQGEMEKVRDGKKAELEAKQKEILDLKKRLEEGQLSLAADRLEAMKEEYEGKVLDLDRAQKDANREIQRRGEKLLSEVEGEIMPVINRIASEQGFTLIFNKFQAGLLFADDQIDITAQIITALDAATSSGG